MLARPPDIPKLISFSAVLSRWLRKSFFFSFFFPFFFAGEWSRHVCQWQGSLLSLTLITSFTNLQIYYSTVCKEVSAITSSVVSRPVMTTGPMKLANLEYDQCRKIGWRHFFFKTWQKWVSKISSIGLGLGFHHHSCYTSLHVELWGEVVGKILSFGSVKLILHILVT